MKMDFSHWLFAFNLLMVLKVSLGIDKQLACAVCRALVDEVNYSISQVDPRKKIQVGSFRVDSKGNQGTYEKSYARSEVHLVEIFENVCDNFKDYAETNNDAGERSVGRIKARAGKTLALKDIKVNADIQKSLKFSCESLLEEYEDDIVGIFTKEEEQNEEELICKDLTERCTAKDLQVAMPKTEFAGMDDIIKDVEADEEKEEQGEPDELLSDYFKDNQEAEDNLSTEETKDEL